MHANMQKATIDHIPSEIVPSDPDEDEEDQEFDEDDYDSEEDEDLDQDDFRNFRRRSQFIDIDNVSLSETPRSERIRNALEQPAAVTLADERGSGNLPRSNFLSKGIERAQGTT